MAVERQRVVRVVRKTAKELGSRGSYFELRKKQLPLIRTLKIQRYDVRKVLNIKEKAKNRLFGWGPEEPRANSQGLLYAPNHDKNHISRTGLKSTPLRDERGSPRYVECRTFCIATSSNGTEKR